MVIPWRHSITTTIALTVVVAMVLGFSLRQLVNVGWVDLGLASHLDLPPRDMRLAVQLAGRIALLIESLDKIPNPQRPVIIAAVEAPEVHIELLDAPVANLIDRGEYFPELLRHRIETLLSVPRILVAASRPSSANQPQASNTVIEASLSDGHWLLFTTSVPVLSDVDPVAARFSWVSFAT